jgi:predicted neuraminidase
VSAADTQRGDTSGVAPGLVADDLPAPTIQCHAANLMPLGKDELGCVWFGGTQEGVADISVWFSRKSLSSADATWSEPVALSNDPERSEQNPILFPAPDGALWLLHTAQRSGNQDTAIVRCRRSTDGGNSWSAPEPLLPGTGVFVRQPVVVHGDDWLLPIFHCRTTPGVRWSGDNDHSAVMISSDRGRTWREHAVPSSTGCVHMNVVSARDGDPLLAFYRSRWADHVYRSTSNDGGRTWSAPVPTSLPNNNSSIQVTRLASGRLAIVFNHISGAQATERRVSLYDEIEDEGAQTGRPELVEGQRGGQGFDKLSPNGKGHARTAFWGTPRAPLTVALSNDDGLTWPHRRDIETGDGYCMTNNSADRRNRELSYPSIVQTADGTLHAAYTHHRQRIRHVSFAESWVTQEAHA